jgi:hypothetical protein
MHKYERASVRHTQSTTGIRYIWGFLTKVRRRNKAFINDTRRNIQILRKEISPKMQTAKLRYLHLATVLILLTSAFSAFGQAASTIASGNWDDPLIWSTGTVPNSTFAAITVRHTVNVRASVYPLATPLLVDQLVIGANGFSGYLVIDAGAYMNVANGAGTDVTLTGAPTIGKVDVSGTFVALAGIALTGNSTANLNFLSGSTYEHRHTAAATALPTATYNTASTVLITGFAGNANISSVSWEVALGNVTFNCPNLAAGVVDFGGHLSNIQGDLSIVNTGTTGIFTLKATAVSSGQSTINIGGDLTVSGLSRFRVATTASNIVVNVGNDFTFSPSVSASISQQVSTGSATINVSGKVSMTSGSWNFASGNNGVGTINVLGTDFDDTGGTVLTTTGGAAANGNIGFTSTANSQQINIDPTAIGTGIINLLVNNTSGSPDVTLLRNLTVSALNLQAGRLDINGLSLTVNGAVTQTSGILDASSASTLIFGGTGAFPLTALSIPASAQFTLFRLSRPSQTLITNTNFTVTTLDLLAGTLNNTASTPQIINSGIINVSATSAANTGVLSNAVSAAGTYNVSYTNNVALASGPELPSTTTALQDLTKAGTNTLTVGKSIKVNGNLTVSAGTFALSNTFNIDLVGNFVSNAASTMGNATSTFTFATGNVSTATLSGTTAPTFGALVFSDDVNISLGFRVNGNLTVDPGKAMNVSAGVASFGGTTLITNNGSLNLNAVTVLAAGTLTAPTGTLVVAGNFIVTNGTSTFAHNGGTVQFNGSSALSGTGVISFRNISVPGTKVLTSAVGLTVNGNISNDGAITFSAGTLTLPSAGTTISGSGATTFSAVSVSTGATVAQNSPVTTAALTVNGTATWGVNAALTTAALTLNNTSVLTVNAPLTTNGACTLNNTSTLTGSATTNHLAGLAVTGTYTSTTTVNFAGTTTMTGAGAKTMRDVNVTGTLTPNGVYTITRDVTLSGTGKLNAGNSTTTFNATSTISNSGSGTMAFNAVSLSTGSAVSLSSPATMGAVTLNGTASLGINAALTTAALTLNSTSTVTVNAPLTTNGACTLNNTSALTGSAATTHAAALAVTGTYTSTTTVNFTGTTTMTGAGAKTMRDVNITGSLTPNAAYTITRNLAISGTGILNAGNNTTTFNGTASLSNSGSGTAAFFNLTISGGTSLTSTASFSITGTAFTGTGSFATSGNTTFSRAGTTTLTGAGSKTFAGVTINGTTTMTPNAAYTVTGNMVINGILSAGNNTATFGGTTAITTTGTPTIGFNNLTISPSSSLTAYGGVMTVNGTFTNNGTFNHNNGTVTFAGNTTKNITSATPSSTTGFYNITISNGTATPDVSIESGTDLFGVLTLAATAVLDADGTGNNRIFTVRSTGDGPTVDAAITTIPAGASITGSVTVQRYMSIEGANSNRIYRYVSSAVQNASVSDLQNEIPVSGSFSGASACTGCSTSPSLYWYDETVTTGGINGGYSSYPVSANTETLATGRGYTVYVRGNTNPVLAAGSARFDLRGPINSGNINFGVTYTTTGIAANDGWNLVGNPYPATLDWNAASWTKTNVGGTIYTTNNGANPTQVATWNGAVGTNGGTRYIGMGQGFFVQTTGAAPVLSTTETAKAAGTQTTFFREMEPSNVLSILLSNGASTDEAVVYFNNDALPSFDLKLDAIKLKNLKNANSTTPFLNVSTLSEDKRKLAINSMPETFCASNIKVDVADVPVGSYSLSFSRFESFDPAAIIMLTDHFTTPATTVDVRLQGTYTFQVTADTLSKGFNRFQLSFALPQLPTELLVSTAEVCASDAFLQVYNSLPGVEYFISNDSTNVSEIVAGNGSTIQLALDSRLLVAGVNTLTVTGRTNQCTVQSVSQAVNVNVIAVSTALNTSDPAAVCPGGTKLLTVDGAPSDGSYNWYNPGESESLANEHGSAFTTAALAQTQVYQVAAANAAGCEGPRVNVEAVVADLIAPTITVDNLNNTMQSSYASGNRWYKGEILLQDTSALLTLTTSGHYTLMVTAGSCTNRAEIDFTMSVVELAAGDEVAFTAYPNPVADILTVELPESSTLPTISVTGATGAEVGRIHLRSEDGRRVGEFDFSDQPSGIYIVRTERGAVKIVKR